MEKTLFIDKNVTATINPTMKVPSNPAPKKWS